MRKINTINFYFFYYPQKAAWFYSIKIIIKFTRRKAVFCYGLLTNKVSLQTVTSAKYRSSSRATNSS